MNAKKEPRRSAVIFIAKKPPDHLSLKWFDQKPLENNFEKWRCKNDGLRRLSEEDESDHVVITRSFNFDLSSQVRDDLIQAAEALKRERFKIEEPETTSQRCWPHIKSVESIIDCLAGLSISRKNALIIQREYHQVLKLL